MIKMTYLWGNDIPMEYSIKIIRGWSRYVYATNDISME